MTQPKKCYLTDKEVNAHSSKRIALFIYMKYLSIREIITYKIVCVCVCFQSGSEEESHVSELWTLLQVFGSSL